MILIRSLLLLSATPLIGSASTPFIDSFLPPSAAPGTGPLILNIHGGNFAATATVNFAGLVLSPVSATASSISVAIPAAALMAPGTASVTVVNAAAARSNAVSFPIATPAGGFTVTSTVYPINQPRGITTGDFNGDGHADIAVNNLCTSFDTICSPSKLLIFPGNGSGGFGSPVSTDACAAAGQLIAADVNADGRLDLIQVCDGSNEGINVLLGDGTGHFQTSFIAIGRPNVGDIHAITAGDFNRDGKLDLIVAGTVNGPWFLAGAGDGTFTVGPALCSCDGAWWLATGDFNGDGQLDFASTFYYDSFLTIWIGDGAGNFTRTTQAITGNPQNLATGDFNGDGKVDIAVAVVTFGDPRISNGYIFLGDGSGAFTARAAPLLLHASDLAAGDLNNDQKLDLVAAYSNESPGGPAVLFGNGDGTLTSGGKINLSSLSSSPSLADFNEDGRLDIALIDPNNNALGVLLQSTSQAPGLRYSITDLCAPQSCSLSVLANNGLAAGINVADFPSIGTSNFSLAPGNSFIPLSINIHGLIAGYLVDPSGLQQAAVWDTQNARLLNLDPVYGWTHGIASYINDANFIVGYSDASNPVRNLVNGLALTSVAAWTDNNIILGADSTGAIAFSLSMGVTRLPIGSIPPKSFSSSGQVLLTYPQIGSLFTPGSGTSTQTLVPGFIVRAFNNIGQYAGVGPLLDSSQRPLPSLYTGTGAVLALNSLIDSASGWALTDAVAINDAGQILVTAAKGARITSLLLTPEITATPMPHTKTDATRQAPVIIRRTGCNQLTFNSAPLCRGNTAASATK